MQPDHPTTLLRQCIDILDQIQREYPEADFDREMLHGDMDFRYKRIHELRQRLDEIPSAVRRFALCLHGLSGKGETPAKVLSFLRQNPGVMAAAASRGFHAVQDLAEETAGKMGLGPSDFWHVLSRLRLAGILTKDYELSEAYLPMAAAVLDLRNREKQAAG